MKKTKEGSSTKVLWVNPSFLDYRIPLYTELYKQLGGEFYLIYSSERVPERCRIRIKEELGDHAIELLNEKRRRFLRDSSGFSNRGVTIPYPKGLTKLIKKVKPDILIAEGFFQFTPWCIKYATTNHIPLLVAYERTNHTERNCPWYRMFYRRIARKFINGYIANGQLTKEHLMGHGVKAENIFTGGMCADSAGLAKSVSLITQEDLALYKSEILGERSNKDLTYLIVGRMIELKGVNYALDAWREHVKKYPDDTLLIVGDGPKLDEYRRDFINVPSVLFTGAIDYSVIYKYYAVSDVFMIATIEDNWSLVVPEAMACGLPIASSIYNGCHPELVHKDENGITFNPLQHESVVKAFEYFHHVDLNAFGTASIAIEKNFNPEHTANNIVKAVDYYINK